MQAMVLRHAYGDSVTIPVLMSKEMTLSFPGEQDGGPQVLWTALSYNEPLRSDVPLAILWNPHTGDLDQIGSQIPSKTPVIVIVPSGASTISQNFPRPAVVFESAEDLKTLLYRVFATLLVPALHEGALGIDVADLPFALERGGRGHLIEVRGSTFSRASQSLLRQIRRLPKSSASSLVLHIAAPVGSVRIPSMLDALFERLLKRSEETSLIPALTVSMRSIISMHALVVMPEQPHDA